MKLFTRHGFLLVVSFFNMKLCQSQITNFWDCGSSFVTCGPGQFDLINETFSDGQVCGIIDVRNTCDFKKAPSMTLSDTYLNKMYFPSGSAWNFSNLGTVFSVAIDMRGDIFVASTTIFGSVPFPDGVNPNFQRGSGSIYKIDGSTGNINTNFINTIQANSFNSSFPFSIPNKTFAGNWGPLPSIQYSIKSGPGLGDLAYNKYHDFIYASNFEDGSIYKIDPNSGMILNIYDPRFGDTSPTGLDNGTDGFSPRGQRPWALGVFKFGSKIKLFYSLWNVDKREESSVANIKHNEIWSVELDASGNPIIATEIREIEVPFLNNTSSPTPIQFASNPISDLAFSINGDLILVEKGMDSDIGHTLEQGCISTCNISHHARMLRYQNVSGNWNIYSNPLFYELANTAYKTNSAGGCDVGYNTCVSTNCDSLIWVTGDYNQINSSVRVYGAAGIDFNVGFGNNHRFVDFNGVLMNSLSDIDKSEIGDIEIFKCENFCLNCCDSVIIYKTDSCCSHLESTCEVKSINISVANGTISNLFWNCGTIPPGYLGGTNFTYTPTTACPLALDLCVNANGLNPVTITYTITFIDGSSCIKTETKNCPCAHVSGELWHDLDNDGIQETGEPTLFPYTVNLIDLATGNIIMTTLTTSPNGAYSFSCMPPGQYYVQFVPPPGYEPSPFNSSGPTTDSNIDHLNGNYNTDIFAVNSGDTIQNLDAGLFNCCDFVIIENTSDSCCSRITSLCAVDSIKVNVQNGTISLISWNCAPRLNNYFATGLSDFTLAIPNNCPLSFGVCVNPVYTNPYAPVIVTYTVYSVSGAVCVKSDTLYCPCAVITGDAWYDLNGDGIAQQTENGINGMLIQLVDAMSGLTISTTETMTRPGTSSDDGYYEFPCVLPGMYFIRFDSLNNYTSSTPFQGSNPAIDSDVTGTFGPYTTHKITVQNGDTIHDIDAGYKDSSAIASGHLTVAGLITAGPSKAMLSSKVFLSTSNNPYFRSAWSHYSGNYAFADLIPGQDYRISAENDEDHGKGVSTLDVLLIQKHILGIKALDNPYKLIAADVTNSQNITAADLTEIRRLILGVNDRFPKNKSWRFIPKNYVFKNPASPFPFEESILHSKMADNKMSSDFYAVKIGDVNGNALDLVNNMSRSGTSLQLTLEKSSYLKNQDILIPVRLAEGIPISGLQLALKLDDDLEFVAIEKGCLNINKENYNYNRGQLLISFSDVKEFTTQNTPLFILKLKARVDLNTNGKIVLSNHLDAEVYRNDDRVIPVEINISAGNTISNTSSYKFYPARPNPFKQETFIEFELPDAETMVFTIFNPEGKMVWTKENIYNKGHNQLSLSKQELGQAGLYYLHIRSNGFYKTQRILLLE